MKHLFKIIDHACIYLLIAGTYTPFTLITLRGSWGWTLFGIVWAMTFLGIIFQVFFVYRFKILATLTYFVMGWLVVIAAPEVMHRVPLSGLAWILAGGIAYTGGVGFYAAHRVRYAHFAWHLFVIAGTVCHFFAVLWYSA